MIEKEWMEGIKERLEKEESFLKKKIFFRKEKRGSGLEMTHFLLVPARS